MKQNLFNKLWLRVGMIVAIMTTALCGTAWAQTYTLATSLSVGDEVVLVDTDVAKELSGISTTSTPYGTVADVENSTPTGKLPLTVVAGSASGTFAFKTSENKYLSWSSGNSLTTETSVTNNSSWNVSFSSSDVATITNVNTSTRKLQYNSSNPRFACYTSSQKAVKLFKKETGGTTTVAKPVISGEESFLTSTEVSISCATDGAAILYNTGGDTWETYSEPFTLTETTTIQAKATKSGMTDSDVESKTFTKVTPMTISAARAQETGTVATTGVVTSVNGKTAYIQDANAAIVVFGSSNLTCAVGDEILVVGTLDTYNGLLEIKEPTVTVQSSGNTVTPQVMTIAQVLASTNQGWLVKIEGAEVTAIDNQNVTLTQGTDNVTVRFNKSSDINFEVGDEVTLTGNIGYFNAVQIANPTNVVVAENTDPVLSVTPAVANVGFEATNGTLDVEATNFSLDDVEEEDFQYFTYDGSDYTSSSKPEWLTVSYNGTERKISYSVTANDGEARSAYFKLALAYGEEDIYSDIITINQAAYVAPVADYATLPFEFEGGKSAIENTAGLTQSGLGSDYSSAPLLKFDGTGDYVILKINERPGVLTFDIKGNTFSGGTFKVQTSEDGETYTDVATYTTLGDTETKTISNLEASVRYIKWIYTEKVSGNVGLGNINLAQYVVLSDYTLTIDNPANVTITANYGEEVKSNGDNAEVTQGTEVTLAITPDSGYDIETVTITGAEEGQIVTPTETSSEGVYTFTMPAYDVTVSATVVEHVEPATASYVLATSITSGKTYVIANAAGTKVMGGQNSNNRAAVDATLDGTTLTAANACEFVIEGNATDGYTIYDGTGYLYAASSNNNYLRTQAENDENGVWAIEFDDETGVASVVAQGTNSRNVMQYNNGSTLFACYGSASQTAIKLYEKVEEVPTSQTVTLCYDGCCC